MLVLLKVSIAIIILILLLTVAVIKFNKKILPGLILLPSIALISYYLWHVAGMAWSSNLEYGYKDLEMKLSFLVFPIIFSAFEITPAIRKKTLTFFATGCILTCSYLLSLAINKFETDGDINNYFYVGLSPDIHPAYISMYVIISIIICLGFINPMKKIALNIFLLAIVLFLMIFLIMLTARMAIISGIFIGSIFIYLHLATFSFIKKISFALLFIVAASSLFYISNSYYNRMSQISEVVTEIENDNKVSPSAIVYNSSSSRPELWKETLHVIKSNLLIGTGTGDIKDELRKEFIKNNFKYAIERNLNPHNQYLHTTTGLGIIGLLLLLLCFGSQLVQAIRLKDWLYLSFILVFAINALTESNIEVEKGIILFCFLSMFFNACIKRKELNTSS